MNRRQIASIVSAFAVVAAGCGDDDDGVDPPRDAGGGGTDGGMTMEDGGTTSDDGGTGERTFTIRFENVGEPVPFLQSGVFNDAVGEPEEPGPLTPGDSYELSFYGAPGMNLSFATMFIPSNDWFYAPNGEGIALFDDANMPVTGDVTDQVLLWDAGTEEDQPIGEGDEQPMRGDGSTPDDDTSVRTVASGEDDVPEVADVVEVTLDAEEMDGAVMFTLTIENVSDGVPLSPGVYVVHRMPDPLFTEGEADRGEGLEAIAESGMPGELAAAVEAETGLTVVASPGVWAVTGTEARLFMVGTNEIAAGLEAIAEDGDPSTLAEEVGPTLPAAGVFNMPEGADEPGPLPPGMAYEVTVTAEPGQRLHWVSMFVPSNDWIISLPMEGIALFDEDGEPVTGDVADQLAVYDVGTEVDQPVGFGLDSVMFQSGADTGADDPDDTVRAVDTTELPDVTERFELTLSVE